MTEPQLPVLSRGQFPQLVGKAINLIVLQSEAKEDDTGLSPKTLDNILLRSVIEFDAWYQEIARNHDLTWYNFNQSNPDVLYVGDAKKGIHEFDDQVVHLAGLRINSNGHCYSSPDERNMDIGLKITVSGGSRRYTNVAQKVYDYVSGCETPLLVVTGKKKAFVNRLLQRLDLGCEIRELEESIGLNLVEEVDQKVLFFLDKSRRSRKFAKVVAHAGAAYAQCSTPMDYIAVGNRFRELAEIHQPFNSGERWYTYGLRELTFDCFRKGGAEGCRIVDELQSRENCYVFRSE